MALLSKEKNYIIVALDEERLRISYLKAGSVDWEILHTVKRDIRGIAEDEIPQTIKSALSDLNVKKAETICVISSEVATTKNIEVPSLDPEEIKSIINLQAGRHTPYSREEIIVGYSNIGVYQRNYSKILLVIVNRDVIKKKFSILDDAGLKADYLVFSPEAIAGFYASVLNLTVSDAPVGIVDIGYNFTDFVIGLQGKIVACRNIPVGLTHLIKEGPEAQRKLADELKKSIESYQSEDIEKPPTSYILTNDQEQTKNLRPILQDTLQATVKIVPYLDNVKISLPIRKSIKDISDESFLDVIASGVALDQCQIDLVPEEIKMQKSIAEQGKEVAKSGIFVSIFLLLICGLFISKIHFKSTTLKNIKTEYQAGHEEAEALERIAEKTRLIKDYVSTRLVSLETLNEIYKIIPDEIYLGSIDLTEGGTITIQGVSESMSRVFSFVSALEDSQYFKNVKTKSTTAKKERGKDVAAFEIVFRLESAKGEEEMEEEVVEKPAEEQAEEPEE